jgi:hypothetical protein
MRVLCFLFLVAVGVAAFLFFRENSHELTVTFLNWSIHAPVATIVGVAYGLGMLTGWSVVGLLRRSFASATDFRRREATAIH